MGKTDGPLPPPGVPPVARKARETFTLPDLRRVGYGFINTKGYLSAQFKHPTESRYLQASTGIEVPARWYPGAAVPGEAYTKAAHAILKAYAPTIPPDPKTATWETIMDDLQEHEHLRPRAFEVYTSMLSVFRSFVPESKGPGDVTVETAKKFRHKYATTPYTRSPKPGAKTYRRTPKTVENSVRRLSALWGKLKPRYTTENPWEYIDRPQVPKTLPQVPTETDVDKFFEWLERRHPGWKLPRLFVEVKALTGCRLNDLCLIKSDQLDPILHTLTILPHQDKTHRQRQVPLPGDLSAALNEIKGQTYLWERYTEDAQVYRPGGRRATEFTPFILYNAIKSIFQEHRRQGGKLKSHGLRKRAITLMTLATQNIEQTAQAIGIDSSTARRYYLDARQAFETDDVFKRMAAVLRPKQG